ncbi:Dbl homology domain-containing protein [Phycomyces nitens]|nr:Dbl homology domain-containing protein [Phycomyces nitens]
MPPLLQSNWDSVQTRAWASSTVDSFLCDPQPISFEPAHQNKKTNAGRRSMSIIEQSLLRPTRSLEGTRSKPRPLTANSHFGISQDCQTATPTSSHKLKRGWTFDQLVLHFFTPTHSLRRKVVQKQQQGIILWQDTFHESLRLPISKVTTPQSAQQPRSVQLKKFILDELLTTETTYLQHLRMAKMLYMDPLLKAAQATPPLLNLRLVESIFAFLPQLIVLSTNLVDWLTRCICSSDKGVGQVFCEMEGRLEIYIGYAANYATCQRSLAKADRSSAYRQVIEDSRHKKESHRMELSDYLIAPIQRITRYCLLFKDLQKHTPSTDQDYPSLDRSLKCLTALALAMNNIQ